MGNSRNRRMAAILSVIIGLLWIGITLITGLVDPLIMLIPLVVGIAGIALGGMLYKDPKKDVIYGMILMYIGLSLLVVLFFAATLGPA